jgi:hypothetical protein
VTTRLSAAATVGDGVTRVQLSLTKPERQIVDITEF